MRFMTYIYDEHTFLSSKFRIPAENNFPAPRTRYRKRKSKIASAYPSRRGLWSSLVTAGMGERGWGTGGRKKEAGGARPGQYPHTKFW
jgi:hypothetical protein